MVQHEYWMQQALMLAEKGRQTVFPNPMVGCVIVKNDELIAAAYHQKAGCAHAEVLALDVAGEEARGATLYVNLEPCCHFGKTPPCADRIIKAGIKTVVAAVRDSNPLVAGQGLAQLKAAGIEVIEAVCEQEAKALNIVFFHAMLHARPFVIAKWAMSLDGKMETAPADDRVITGEESHAHVHQVRHAVDAILVGANTVIQDDPSLTQRHLQVNRQPLRVVLADRAHLPLTAKIFNDDYVDRTLVYMPENLPLEKAIIEKGAGVVITRADHDKIDLSFVLHDLHQRQVRTVYVEGGRKTHEAFFSVGLVDEVHCYISSKVIGRLDKKLTLLPKISERLGDDWFVMASVDREES